MAQLTVFQQILAIFSGLLVGFSLGLIGGGGSILAVPLLLYLVGYHAPHIVIGTTALAVAITAYINLIPHWRAGHVHWRTGIIFAIPGILGTIAGSTLGKIVPGNELLFLFALLMLIVAVLMLRNDQKPVPDRNQPGRLDLLKIVPISFAVGLLSGFFGIGGGFLIVPGLIFATQMSIINAIGTSLIAVGAFGTSAAINYALSGLVNWLVAGEYILGGVLGGTLGTQLATRLSKQKKVLTRIFAGIIILVALYMLYMSASSLVHQLR